MPLTDTSFKYEKEVSIKI